MIVIILVVVIVVGLLMPLKYAGTYKASKRSADAQNARQVALAAIMYGGDFDDHSVPTVNGWLCRVQDIGNKDRTVNCPAPGTQQAVAHDAAGAQRADTWAMLLIPYMRSYKLYVDPGRGDVKGYFSAPPMAANQPGYRPDGPTYRNQELFPDYGYNYMYLSPLQVPASRLSEKNPANYATASVVSLTKVANPEATVFFIDSQYDFGKGNRGFFAVNAPGMWQKFLRGDRRAVAFWRGTAGSGDWSQAACTDLSSPCRKPADWHGFVATQYNDGANVTFVDGHVKYMKAIRMADGTNYPTTSASADGSTAVITDPNSYIWDLN